MTNRLILSARDEALLRLLDHTPATTTLILKASESFPGDAFHDERRVRERLQSLAAARFVRAFPATHGVGGPINWYKLTAEGYRVLHGAEVDLPHRSRFETIAPSRFQHTWALAEVIVQIVVAAHRSRTAMTVFQGDGEAALNTGRQKYRPDCFFQFTQSGKSFNVYFEIDQSTEPLNSRAEQSIRTKLIHYEACQDAFIAWWKGQSQPGPRPFFRVVFLTRSWERAYHILWLARECARNPDRHLAYAATQDSLLAEPRALHAPMFLDHHGRWQSLVNLHPTSDFVRTPVRLSRPVTSPVFVW